MLCRNRDCCRSSPETHFRQDTFPCTHRWVWLSDRLSGASDMHICGHESGALREIPVRLSHATLPADSGGRFSVLSRSFPESGCNGGRSPADTFGKHRSVRPFIREENTFLSHIRSVMWLFCVKIDDGIGTYGLLHHKIRKFFRITQTFRWKNSAFSYMSVNRMMLHAGADNPRLDASRCFGEASMRKIR